MMAHQDQLSEEICMEILERLSVKSLIRFRTVCKSWRSLISTPDFIDRHFNRSATNSDKLGIVLVHASPENLCFHGPQCSIYLKTINLSPKSLGETMNTFDQQVVTKCQGAWPLGSCRGLVLLGVDCIDFKLLLSNPSTRESKEIPDPPYRRLEYDYIFAYALGYDFNIKSHKIVLIYGLGEFEYCIWVYTLKTNSWTCVDLDTDHKYANYDILPVTLVNGAPHWMIQHGDVKDGDVSNFKVGGSIQYAIEYFDFAVNNFVMVPQPDNYDKRKFCITPQLYDTEESLYIVYRRGEDDCTLEIWVMKRYGVKESWLKWMSFENEYVPFPLCFAKNNINVSLFLARGRGKDGCAIYIGKEKEIELGSLGFRVSFDGRTGQFEFDRCLKKRAFAFDESLICLENDEGGEGHIRRKLNSWELEPGEKSISYFVNFLV
ncbi:hypothetical protein COLO4_25673 [Corchorus olitorius]|uniref:F-box domain-containing protein n=1 Tax=Corchorus olitorius TaxID=93759 RepID=A0A1R3I0K6_9ROSI|nr:hypothetical protein COLO4_25673 [Corchorus olitorius]